MEEFHFAKTQVVTRNYIYDSKRHVVELLLVGQPLESSTIDSLRNRMPIYGLENTELVVYQGLDAKQKIDLSAIKASVLEEIYATGRLMSDTAEQENDKLNIPIPDLEGELKALYPTLVRYSLSNTIFNNADTVSNDTITLFVGKFSRSLANQDRKKLGVWLKQRIPADSVRIIVE